MKNESTNQPGYFDIREAVLSAAPTTVDDLLETARLLACDNDAFADKLYNPQQLRRTEHVWRKHNGEKYTQQVGDDLESNIVWHTILETLDSVTHYAFAVCRTRSLTGLGAQMDALGALCDGDADAEIVAKDQSEKAWADANAAEEIWHSHGTGVELLQLALHHLSASVMLRTHRDTSSQVLAGHIVSEILPFLLQLGYLPGHAPQLDRTGITSVLLAEVDLIDALLEVTDAIIVDGTTPRIGSDTLSPRPTTEVLARVVTDAQILSAILTRAKAGYAAMEIPFGLDFVADFSRLKNLTPWGMAAEDLASLAYAQAHVEVQQQSLDPLLTTLQQAMSSPESLMHYVRALDPGAMAALEKDAPQQTVTRKNRDTGAVEKIVVKSSRLVYSVRDDEDDSDADWDALISDKDDSVLHDCIAAESASTISDLDDDDVDLTRVYFLSAARDAGREAMLIRLPSPAHVATVLRASKDTGVYTSAIPALEKLRGGTDEDDSGTTKRGGGPWSKDAKDGLPDAMAILRVLDPVPAKEYGKWLAAGAAGAGSPADTQRKVEAYKSAPVADLLEQIEDYREACDPVEHAEAVGDSPLRARNFYLAKGGLMHKPADENGIPLPDWLTPTGAGIGLDYRLVRQHMRFLADLVLTIAGN